MLPTLAEAAKTYEAAKAALDAADKDYTEVQAIPMPDKRADEDEWSDYHHERSRAWDRREARVRVCKETLRIAEMMVQIAGRPPTVAYSQWSVSVQSDDDTQVRCVGPLFDTPEAAIEALPQVRRETIQTYRDALWCSFGASPVAP